ncbi:hypothetical protein BD626DRAFT_79273 [Schizophyllum amplum]|uniref:DRBM domain-containing protein n=1 Tax=Schizophyllum amplum TaxID=97359 RepID=A0A550C9Q0_9AGAR|nr:hypothetical protein BD626DRAFT_79273 [Auriculariopsis ampla]
MSSIGNRTRLNKYAQLLRRQVTWSDQQAGPASGTTWRSTVFLDGYDYGNGRGSSKDASREDAAARAIIALRNEGSIS